MATDSERYARNAGSLTNGALNAIVCGSATAVLLFNGYWPVMAASVVVFTAEGELSLILPEDELELARATSAAHLIPYEPAGLHTLESPLQRLKSSLGKVLKPLMTADARIGTQFSEGMQPASYVVGTEFRSALPELLKTLLPHARLFSCDALIQSLRAVKTGVELDLMQKACNVAATGFARAEATFDLASVRQRSRRRRRPRLSAHRSPKVWSEAMVPSSACPDQTPQRRRAPTHGHGRGWLKKVTS